MVKGINKENLEKFLFHFFQQKKEVLELVFLVKKIINFHNGGISVNSNNKVTNITIKLPLEKYR